MPAERESSASANEKEAQQPPVRFHLGTILAAISILAVLLAIPPFGALLLSGMSCAVVFFALTLAVQYPIFRLLRRQLTRSRQPRCDDPASPDSGVFKLYGGKR